MSVWSTNFTIIDNITCIDTYGYYAVDIYALTWVIIKNSFFNNNYGGSLYLNRYSLPNLVINISNTYFSNGESIN